MFALRAVRGPSLQPTSSLGTRRGGHRRARVRARSSDNLAPLPHGSPTRGERVHLAHLARARQLPRARRHDARARGARRRPHLGRDPLHPPAERAAPRPSSARARAWRSSGPSSTPRPTRPRPEAQRAAIAQELNPRLTFDQFVIGDCNRLAHARRARGRRDARPGLQPALHLRPARARQDPPAALDRQLRARARRRPDRPLHDRRGLHRPLRRRAPGRRDGGVQGGLPRRRRPARRRRPVPAEQGQDRAGVLPHLQRAAPGRRAARADLRPPAARHRRARGPAARALRGRPRVRRAPARARHASDDPAQARRPGRRRRGRPGGARADRRPRRRRTSARSRAR